jgi:hypothetical protein
MQHLQEATRTEAVNELVQRLAEDVRKTRGGNPMSSKLRQTAVGVLVGRPQVTLPSQREKVMFHQCQCLFTVRHQLLNVTSTCQYFLGMHQHMHTGNDVIPCRYVC